MKKSQIDLARYRLNDANEKLESARILFRENKLKDSLSRSYYAMFSAMRSLLALKELDSSKHSGIISLFNQHFIKTNIIDASFGRIINKAQYSRQRSDYGDYITVTNEEVENQISDAQSLICEINNILDKGIV